MPLKVYLKVFDEKTGKLIGYLVDVNSDGLLVTSEASIETNVVSRLKLELPTEIEGSQKFFFSATSMWSEKDRESNFYNTGFRFEEVSDKDKKIIERMIEKFCFR
jgi:c-di-GMP-binding flagellar brake protein YcgR